MKKCLCAFGVTYALLFVGIIFGYRWSDVCVVVCWSDVCVVVYWVRCDQFDANRFNSPPSPIVLNR